VFISAHREQTYSDRERGLQLRKYGCAESVCSFPRLARLLALHRGRANREHDRVAPLHGSYCIITTTSGTPYVSAFWDFGGSTTCACRNHGFRKLTIWITVIPLQRCNLQGSFTSPLPSTVVAAAHIYVGLDRMPCVVLPMRLRRSQDRETVIVILMSSVPGPPSVWGRWVCSASARYIHSSTRVLHL